MHQAHTGKTGHRTPPELARFHQSRIRLAESVSLYELQRIILAEALKRNSNNVSLTARVLGTARDKLRYRMQKYGFRTCDQG